MKKGALEIKGGFTLIEVMLVLAIAGLIFMMMMIALPTLQRIQRDSRRKDDVLVLLEQIKKYQTNHRGALPDNAALSNFRSEYLGGDNFVDPDGTKYNINFVTCGGGSADRDCTTNYSNATFPNGHNMTIVGAATCNGEKAVQATNLRKVAVIYKLEGGGVFCANT